MNSKTVSPAVRPSVICTFSPSVRPSPTARFSLLPSAATTQTLPFCTVPWTAVIGTTTTSAAEPLVISTVAPRPGNAVTPAGIAHVTVPEDVVVSGSVPVVGAAPTRSPVQSNGAGPPLRVTLACVGAPTSRYCWSGVSVPVTESVPGATLPTSSPTDPTWSLSVGSDSVPATGAFTV